MRLREIKPGMVIHCKNDEEKKALLEEAERLGYRWHGYGEMPTDETIGSGCTIHFYDKKSYENYKCITWSDKTEGVTEFSDLILPELTAEEVLKICGEICKENSDDGYNCKVGCPFAFNWVCCTSYRAQNPDKVIEACEKWKSDHEKKEPEIQTVDICRIIEIMPDGKKRCVHEEDMDVPANKEMEEILKRYCMEHDGEFIAVHEVINRMKK